MRSSISWDLRSRTPATSRAPRSGTIRRLAALHVLRVFTTREGRHGNPLGVFLDGGGIPGERRQAIAHELGFSETVFVDDTRAARLRVYTPALELPFAGHPMVGAAWLLAREGLPVGTLRPPAGELAVRTEGELVFVDPAKVGLHGHSWGGYQSSFLATQTGKLFAGIVTGAPL